MAPSNVTVSPVAFRFCVLYVTEDRIGRSVVGGFDFLLGLRIGLRGGLRPLRLPLPNNFSPASLINSIGPWLLLMVSVIGAARILAQEPLSKYVVSSDHVYVLRDGDSPLVAPTPRGPMARPTRMLFAILASTIVSAALPSVLNQSCVLRVKAPHLSMTDGVVLLGMRGDLLNLLGGQLRSLLRRNLRRSTRCRQ